MKWVKGHSGDFMNDVVDRLAVVAALGPFAPVVEPPAGSSPAQSSLF
jgi:ribonuclease HI